MSEQYIEIYRKVLYKATGGRIQRPWKGVGKVFMEKVF